jgi:hypothetical protein
MRAAPDGRDTHYNEKISMETTPRAGPKGIGCCLLLPLSGMLLEVIDRLGALVRPIRQASALRQNERVRNTYTEL